MNKSHVHRKLLVENKRPDLDALSGYLIGVLFVYESRVRRSPRPLCGRVETLNEHYLVGTLCVLEVPSVAGAVLDRPRLTLVVRVDCLGCHQILVADRRRVGYGERVLEDLGDWAPELPQSWSAGMTRLRYGSSRGWGGRKEGRDGQRAR